MSCGVSLYNPLVGAAAYMMIYQLSPEAQWWGKPLMGLGIRYSLWAAMAMVAGMITQLGTRRSRSLRPMFALWEILTVVIVLIAVAGYLVHEVVYPVQTVIMDKFWKMLFFVLCFTRLVTTRRHLLVVAWVLVVGSLLLGHKAYDTPASEFVSGRLTSVGGPDFCDSSGFAAHMAAMLPLIGATFLVTRRWWLRLIPMIAGAFTVNAIILCRTRSAFVALIVGAATAVVMAPRSWRWKMYPLVIVGAVGAYSLMDDYFVNRMRTMQTAEQRENDAAITLRHDIWRAGIQMIRDNPLGIGIGNFTRRIGEWDPLVRWRSAHNTFLVCAAELGIPGLIVFVLLVGLSLGQLHLVYRAADATHDPAGMRMWVYASLLSMVMYMTAGQFTEKFYSESLWWVLALPTCLRRIALGERQAAATVADAPWRAELPEDMDDEPLPVPAS